MPAIVVVEHPTQVAHLAGRGLPEPSCVLLAMDPATQWACERAGLPHRTPDDYLPEGDYQSLTRTTVAPLDAWCSAVDGTFTAKVPYLREHDLRLARLQYHYLKTVLDTTQAAFETVRRAAAAERAATIWYFPGAGPSRVSGLFVGAPLAPAIAPLVAGTASITARPVANGPPWPPAYGAPQGIRARVRALARASVLGRAYRALRLSGAPGWFRAFRAAGRGRATVLLVEPSADIHAVVRTAEAHENFRWVPWEQPASTGHASRQTARSSTVSDGVAACWDRLRREDGTRSLWRIHDVDLWPIVEPRLRTLLAAQAAGIVAAYERSRADMERERVKVVLTGTTAHATQRAVLHAAHRLGIPTVIYQHGGAYGYRPCPAHWYLDMAWPDVFASYGDGVTSYFQTSQPPFAMSRPRIVSVGSAAIGTQPRVAMPASAAGSARHVLYIATNLSGGYRYGPGASYSDTTTFRLGRRVVDAVCAAPNARLTVKLATGEHTNNPLAAYIRQRHGATVTVATSGALADYLAGADLVVIDWPATTLLQALASGKPVLTLAAKDAIPLPPEARAALERAAVVTDTEDAFIAALQRMVGEPATRAASDITFLQRYATGDPAQAPAGRLLDMLRAEANRPATAGARL